MNSDLNQESLNYHSSAPAGKIKIASSKPLDTQHDLSLAYTPGVGKPKQTLKIFGNIQTVETRLQLLVMAQQF